MVFPTHEVLQKKTFQVADLALVGKRDLTKFPLSGLAFIIFSIQTSRPMMFTDHYYKQKQLWMFRENASKKKKILSIFFFFFLFTYFFYLVYIIRKHAVLLADICRNCTKVCFFRYL